MEPQGRRRISPFRATKRSTKLRRLSKTTRLRVHVQTAGLNAETKKVSAPSRRGRMSLDIPFYRTFPETPIVYTYSFASLESRLADGSAANHTGVLTPSPLFLNVSRFKYLCPANAANPIASLLPLRCALLYMCHKHKRQAICQPAFWSAALFRSITRRNFSAPENATPASYFARTYVTSSVNASFCSLRNVQVVLK